MAQYSAGKEVEALNHPPGKVAPALKQGKVSVTVVGLGRIGLPTAALFAEAGAKVKGYDVDVKVVEDTNAGRCKFVDEPGLGELVAKHAKAGSLRATGSPEAAFDSDFVVICVPTPVDQGKVPDYLAIRRASEDIGRRLKKGTVVITESTVGPGIVEGLICPILEKESGLRATRDFGLAACPERSDPGKILKDMKTLPRIIGATGPKCAATVVELYREALGVEPLQVTSPRTANAVKLTENIFRDVNIALSNEFAVMFEELGIDAKEVIDACATKYNFVPHYPGIGVGGPCLPSNSYYMIAEALKSGDTPYLIRMAREINDRMPDHVVELTSEALNMVGKTVKGSKVAIFGIAYKPEVKDVQLTPVEKTIRRLAAMGAEISVYDPMYKGETALGYRVSTAASEASKGADCIVLGTAHSEFKKLDLAALSKGMRKAPAFVDARDAVSPESAAAAGFVYCGVGRNLRTPG
ncbi:MAG: nucleotide sugar dehydrogenase [Nitrososphaerota archaeon]|nr:nucleotide sugar dehydrogenase [Nitrososphaerota archaeon]